ncbi:MAG: transposase, partial [Candidatus Saccharimonadales bacterium]
MIAPVINKFREVGTNVFTDEYDIYNYLERSGYQHKTVNHSKGGCARD